MKYYFEARSIPSENISIEVKHARFLSRIKGLMAPWGCTADVPAPDVGGALSAGVSVRKFLGKGLSGDVHYYFRGGLWDHPSSDDFFNIYFNPHKIDFAYLVDEVFVAYVEAFDPYYAQITDLEFVHMDFDEMAELPTNARTGLFRPGIVSYMGEEFCRRVWGMGASDMARKFEGQVEQVRCAAGGVVLVLASTALPLEEAKSITDLAKGLITT